MTKKQPTVDTEEKYLPINETITDIVKFSFEGLKDKIIYSSITLEQFQEKPRYKVVYIDDTLNLVEPDESEETDDDAA